MVAVTISGHPCLLLASITNLYSTLLLELREHALHLSETLEGFVRCDTEARGTSRLGME